MPLLYVLVDFLLAQLCVDIKLAFSLNFIELLSILTSFVFFLATNLNSRLLGLVLHFLCKAYKSISWKVTLYKFLMLLLLLLLLFSLLLSFIMHDS